MIATFIYLYIIKGVKILNLIADETFGDSFHCYKLNLDEQTFGPFDYDDKKLVTWKDYGESVVHDTYVDLRNYVERFQRTNSAPLFTYFLDGSRRTYKVDDIAYNNKVFPIIAGQISVVCCKRQNKKMHGGGG